LGSSFSRGWIRAFVGFVLLLPTGSAARADPGWWDDGWAVTAFGGLLSTNESSHIWFRGDFDPEDVTVLGVSVSKRLFTTGPNLAWDFEQQAVKYSGDQDNWEFNSVFIARWLTFPWDAWIDTSLAFGDGLSIATETPELEVARYGRNHSSAVLNFVLLEATFALPSLPGPELFARFQHRSGAFSIINATSDASTFLGTGIRFRF